jgi:hypothetical protein
LAERPKHPILRIAFATAMIALSLGATEAAMRYRDVPRNVVSGWRATGSGGPLNQFGFRGQPPSRRQVTDFVVVLTGGASVECLACPPDETLDVMLERALRRYAPTAHVVTLGARGYAQDQEYLVLHEYLAHQRADLILNWASIDEDVPANTFRSGQPRPGLTLPKPTFALASSPGVSGEAKAEAASEDIVGPTEGAGDQIYHAKLTTLIRPLFIDLDQNWTTLLPAPDPGAPNPPQSVPSRTHVDDALEQQRSPWSIWLTPRPARVKYGIALTRALSRHIRELAALRGARFAILLTPPMRHDDAPIALEHDGRWFLADPATRDAAIAEVTSGFDTIALPVEDDAPGSPEAERRTMARLADALNQRNLLISAAADRPRH